MLAELARLNADYEERHGFRFVVFVNRRPKARDPRRAAGAGRQPDGQGARDGARRARRDRPRPLAAALPLALSRPTDWLDLGLRWLHVIAAMAWIGTSFYFVLLDQSLRAPKEPEDADAGVGGELWEVHGGGFYHVQKYRVAPRAAPEQLAWFKWEAYTTWLSGFGLMLVLYYLEARATLVDPAGPTSSPGSRWRSRSASWPSRGRLRRAQPQLVSDARVLWPRALRASSRSPLGARRELFSPRAAWLQVGRDDRDGDGRQRVLRHHPRPPGAGPREGGGPRARPGAGIQAKQRSVHNNYLTLPVLLTMLAGHFPFAYGRDTRGSCSSR